jgi:hypothetical protein
MLDLDLDQQLRDEFRSAAAGVEPSARLDGLVRQRIVRRQWQRRVTVGGGAALTLALAVAGVAALSGGDGEDSVVMAPTLDDGGGSNTSPNEGVAYLVPNDVPDDMGLVHASGGDQPDLPAGSATQLSEWDTTQRWLHMGSDPLEVVDVQSTDDADTIDRIEFALGLPETVNLADGLEAAYSSADGSIAWVTDDGRAVRVASAGEALQDVETLTAFADAVGDGIDITDSTRLGSLDGEWVGGARWSGSPALGLNPRALVYQAADGRGFQLHVVDRSELSPAMNLSFPGASFPGIAAFSSLSSRLVAPPRVDDPRADFVADADLYLQWVGDHGELITLSGVGLTAEELRAIADEIEPVDADTWFQLQGRSNVEVPGVEVPDVPATTVPDAESLTPPVAGLPGAETLTGAFLGTEHFTLTQDAGCQVHSILTATWTHSSGAKWTYSADYCGKLSGSTWSSSGGAVTLTTEDGSTITGTMNAQTVSTVSRGEPYGLTITGGTGAYAGAAGSCNLDNHLVPVALGVQEQSGSFACSISH